MLFNVKWGLLISFENHWGVFTKIKLCNTKHFLYSFIKLYKLVYNFVSILLLHLQLLLPLAGTINFYCTCQQLWLWQGYITLTKKTRGGVYAFFFCILEQLTYHGDFLFTLLKIYSLKLRGARALLRFGQLKIF